MLFVLTYNMIAWSQRKTSAVHKNEGINFVTYVFLSSTFFLFFFFLLGIFSRSNVFFLSYLLNISNEICSLILAIGLRLNNNSE